MTKTSSHVGLCAFNEKEISIMHVDNLYALRWRITCEQSLPECRHICAGSLAENGVVSKKKLRSHAIGEKHASPCTAWNHDAC